MNPIDSFLHKLSRYSICFPPDVYERHRFVASRINRDNTVLDVGGELGQLKKFSTAQKIVVADLHQGDIQFNGKNLPLNDRSFSVVTAIDVLEHMQKSARKAFIQELWRVTENRLIVSFPLGTQKHLQAEENEQRRLQHAGQSVPYLDEHVRHGLPTGQDADIWLAGRSQKTFVGDYRLSRIFFRLHNADLPGFFGKLFFFFKLIVYVKINLFLYPILIRLPRHEQTNRMYCEWRKT